MNRKIFSGLAALVLMLTVFGAAAPTQAQSLVATGAGKVICQGNGVVAFSGRAASIDLEGVGNVAYTKRTGRFWASGDGWHRYSDGNMHFLVGRGEAHARGVGAGTFVFSGANASFSIVGAGELRVMGTGSCETRDGTVHDWVTDAEMRIEITD